MNTFFEKFFGIQFNPNDRFINEFKQLFPRQSQLWGKKDAVWVDVDDAWKLYIEIPELRAVIDKRASMIPWQDVNFHYSFSMQLMRHYIPIPLQLIEQQNVDKSIDTRSFIDYRGGIGDTTSLHQ